MLNFQTVADLMPRIFPVVQQDEPVCTENLIRVDDVMESPKLAE
jgi:hypothetical protein